MAKKVRVKKDTTYQHLISPDQAATFIDESNLIEDIRLPRVEALAGWMSDQSKYSEIRGQVKALKFVLEKHTKTKISISTICELHTTLMTDLLHPADFGLRREYVQVGSQLCPPPTAIRYMLEKWCEKVNDMKNPTEVDIWNAHLAYEKIHPFIDGNGRSGRLLWLWLRYKHGFGYGLVENATKHELYYPQFGPFNFDAWLLA